MSDIKSTPEDSGTSFPLKRHFYRRIVPGLVLFLLASVFLSVYSARQVMRGIYMSAATERARVISQSVLTDAPAGWRLMLSGQDLSDIATRPEWPALDAAFRQEVKELRLVRLKAYSISGHILFSMNRDEIGKLESNQHLRRVIADTAPSIVSTTDADGAELYELYVPLFDDAGNLRAVFELYEPIGRLNTLLRTAVLTAAVPPGLMLVVLTLALGFLVARAQGAIDSSTRALHDMKARLETMVSLSARTAAQGGRGDGDIPSVKKMETLFYSDVRDFSGFSEINPPERVVRFLNDLMEIQVRIISDHGGDVDKMIGDAVLARFDGDDAEGRAISAARAILEETGRAALARDIGIGIYTGEVICGTIGPRQRRDFTIIGDAVNVAARLSSEAGGCEIVADAATVERSGALGFGAVMAVTVKGRGEPLAVRRLSVARTAQA